MFLYAKGPGTLLIVSPLLWGRRGEFVPCCSGGTTLGHKAMPSGLCGTGNGNGVLPAAW